MPVLAYCMVEAEGAAAMPPAGVRGAPVQPLLAAGLCCPCSEMEVPRDGASAFTREDALVFHRTVGHFFARAAVIPFRFPTVLETEDLLRDFLNEHAARYHELLRSFQDVVQMELRLSAEQRPTDAGSGTDYLRARQASAQALHGAAQAAQSAARGLSREWRCRNTARGLHCFALVGRDAVQDFRQCIAALTPPAGVAVIAGGPWPPLEFLGDVALDSAQAPTEKAP